MTHAALDTASLHDLAAIETDTRFFRRLLLGVGIAAAIVVVGAIAWHEKGVSSAGNIAQFQSIPVGFD